MGNAWYSGVSSSPQSQRMRMIVVFPDPGSAIPYMVQVRSSMRGVSKMRSGGGLTALVAFSRKMYTGGTGVVGMVVIFSTMLPVFTVERNTGNGIACTSVPVSYTHLRAHETDSYLVCRLLL